MTFLIRANGKKTDFFRLPAVILLFGAGLADARDEAVDNVAGSESHYDSRSVRQFTLYNYRQLANDILNDGGIYLSALYELMDIERIQQAFVLEDLKELLIATPGIADFAVKVADYAGAAPGAVESIPEGLRISAGGAESSE